MSKMKKANIKAFKKASEKLIKDMDEGSLHGVTAELVKLYCDLIGRDVTIDINVVEGD